MKRILDKVLDFCASRIVEKRYCGYEYSNFEKWFSFGLLSLFWLVLAFVLYHSPIIGATIIIGMRLCPILFADLDEV